MSRTRFRIEGLEERHLLAADLVVDLNPTIAAQQISEYVELNGEYFFVGRSDLENRGLWKYDPETGTSVAIREEIFVTDLDYFDNPLIVVDDRLVFRGWDAHDRSTDYQIWGSDGTAEGTVILESGSRMIPVSHTELGVCFREYGFKLWCTDGTAEGTTLLYQNENQVRFEPMDIGEQVVFGVWDFRLTDFMTTDGTFEGSERFKTGLRVAHDLLATDDKLYFSAYDESTGFEPWVTDGTEVGTRSVYDVTPGPADSVMGEWHLGHDGHALFSVVTDAGVELWRTEGSRGTTRKVAGFEGTRTELPKFLWSGEEFTLFLAATSEGRQGLWRTDGSGQGTSLVMEFRPENGVRNLTVLGQAGPRILFAVDAAKEIWATDGTAPGTEKITDYIRISGGGRYQIGDRVLFSMRTEEDGSLGPWITDGTRSGTRPLDLTPGDEPTNVRSLVEINGELHFYADLGRGWKPTISDLEFKNIRQTQGLPEATEYASPRPLLRLPSGTIIAQGDDGSGNKRAMLAITTGHEVIPFEDFELSQQDADAKSVYQIGRALYFVENRRLVPAAVSQFPSEILTHRLLGNALFVVIRHGARHWLARTDGTTEGTQLLKHIGNPDGGMELRVFGTQLVFNVRDEMRGNQVWITDGTPTGTRALLDLTHQDNPTESRLYDATADQVFLLTGLGDEEELWATDASTGRAQKLLSQPVDSAPMVAAGLLYFTSADALGFRELWRTDGTQQGTFMLIDINPDGSSGVSTYVSFEVDGTVFFLANDGSTDGRTWWRTRGTSADTQKMEPLLPDLDRPPTLYPWDGRLLVQHENKLYESEGTAASTTEISTAPHRFSYEPDFVVATDGAYLVSWRSRQTGSELFLVRPETVGNPQIAQVDVSLADSSQLQSVSVEFSADVSSSLSVNDLLLTSGTTGLPIDTSSGRLSWDENTSVATWTFDSLDVGYGRFELEFGRKAIYDEYNNRLDGNADGINGDNYVLSFATALAGDINLDGSVNFADFLGLSSNFGMSNVDWSKGDFDGNGEVEFADFLLLSANFGG